jgi:hypothetical protein
LVVAWAGVPLAVLVAELLPPVVIVIAVVVIMATDPDPDPVIVGVAETEPGPGTVKVKFEPETVRELVKVTFLEGKSA